MASRFPFITDAQFELLLANGLQSQSQEDFDPLPVLKLFTPDAGATWLLTEIDPEDHDMAFGLCCTQHKPNYVERRVMQRTRLVPGRSAHERAAISLSITGADHD
ncbi:DUF2958 domain-containing protein (plasmid) [Variovorax sp. WS11]|nr:DUF2958 domain-containing protein [Variovorax sp. WS11]